MANHNLIGMAEIVVPKDQLLATLARNRGNHHAVFEQAVERFRERAVQHLDRLVASINRGTLPHSWYVDIPIPEEHTDDYDKAIRMLQMDIGESVVLSEAAYSRLVDDDWGWKQSFADNTASYLAQ